MIAWLRAWAGSKPTGFTAGFQPTIVPSSVAKRKVAAAEVGRPPLVTPEILKTPVAPPAMLKTRPVGAPLAFSGSPGAGIVTTRDCGIPAVLYNVESPTSASETQNGE